MCFINSKGIDKVLNTQNHNIEIISLLLYLSCTLHGYQRFACFVPMDSICSKVGLDLGHFFLGDLFSHLRVASLGVSSLVLPGWGENILFDEPTRDFLFLFQAHSVGLRDANLQSLSILTFVQCTVFFCFFHLTTNTCLCLLETKILWFPTFFLCKWGQSLPNLQSRKAKNERSQII